MKHRRRRSSATIFSEARFVVLRTLFPSADGVSLREIAYRSGLSVGSVQVSLRSLVKTKLVTRSRDRRRMVFRLNKEHPEYSLVSVLFGFSTSRVIQEQAVKVSLENQSLLRTLTEMSRFAGNMREAQRGV